MKCVFEMGLYVGTCTMAVALYLAACLSCDVA